MSEWTPGPWRKENPDWMTPHIWIAADNDNGGIAKIECCDHDDGHGERLTGTDYANAHLIAAAPDLYEALRRLDQKGHTQATWDFALKAMAKARGETK